MFTTYLDCQITITASVPAGFSVAVCGPGGDARGTLVATNADPAIRELIAHLTAQHIDADTLDDLGQRLFAALFHGPVRDVHIHSQGVLAGGQGMRLTLI